MFCLRMRGSFSWSFSPCCLQVGGWPVFWGGFFGAPSGCIHNTYLLVHAHRNQHWQLKRITFLEQPVPLPSCLPSFHTPDIPASQTSLSSKRAFFLCVEACVHTHIPSVSIPRRGRRCTCRPHMCPPCVGSHNNWRVWRHTRSRSLPIPKEWLTRSRRVWIYLSLLTRLLTPVLLLISQFKGIVHPNFTMSPIWYSSLLSMSALVTFSCPLHRRGVSQRGSK